MEVLNGLNEGDEKKPQLLQHPMYMLNQKAINGKW